MSEEYTVKEHLEANHAGTAEHHEATAEHHRAFSKHNLELAECHEELADKHESLDQPEIAKVHRTIAKIHKAHAATHDQAAEHHAGEAKRNGTMQKHAESIAKGMNAGMTTTDHNRLWPDNVHGIVPIPRTGQRELQKTEVPLEFEKMLSIEDGQ
jgi:hypothetical protein